jgi:hypothetical protein
VLACTGLLVIAMMVIMTACSRPLATVAAQPRSDLTRQSEALDRELNTRNEQELRVRVVNVTKRIMQGAERITAEEAATIEAEVDAINVLLSSLDLPPLAPALRFDPGNGRLVW